MGLRQRHRNILFNWSQTTSSHGIPHIGRAGSWALRIFWSVIFVVAMCLLIWQICLLVDKYLQYDKVTKMELKFKQRPFPAVSICNLNPYVRTLAMKHADLVDLMTTYNETAQVIANNNPAGNTKENIKYGFAGINDTVALESKAKQDLVFLAASKSDAERAAMGYTFEKFVTSCSFNTDDCTKKDFKPIQDPKYGTCFTFNFAKKPKHSSSRAGPLYGLRMVLNTNTEDYLLTSESSGVRVVVHNQTEHPFPDTFGYNAASGYSTSLGISYREIDRLGSPYGDCAKIKSTVAKPYNVMKIPNRPTLYIGKYTMESCFRSCMQYNLVEQCKCADPRYAAPNKTNTAEKVRFCTLEAEDSKCYKSKSMNHSADIAKCSCQQPCQQGVYDVTVSTARWPSGVFMIPGCTDKSVEECTAEARDNALMIEVFYEQLNYKELKESPAYTMVNLVSDFGGQAGLWLGVSVVTGVEVIVLVLQLCCGVCLGKNDQKPPEDDDDEDEKRRPSFVKSLPEEKGGSNM